MLEYRLRRKCSILPERHSHGFHPPPQSSLQRRAFGSAVLRREDPRRHLHRHRAWWHHGTRDRGHQLRQHAEREDEGRVGHWQQPTHCREARSRLQRRRQHRCPQGTRQRQPGLGDVQQEIMQANRHPALPHGLLDRDAEAAREQLLHRSA